MKFLDLAFGESAVVMPEQELRQIITDADKYEALFYDLLRVCLQTAGHKSIPEIEKWIAHNYIDLRRDIPEELKRMYLRNVAFKSR